MDFKTFYSSLSTQERADFAEKVGTTTGYCNQLVYGDKRLELGLADAMVAVSGGRLSLAELNLTDRAAFQERVRKEEAATKESA